MYIDLIFLAWKLLYRYLKINFSFMYISREYQMLKILKKSQVLATAVIGVTSLLMSLSSHASLIGDAVTLDFGITGEAGSVFTSTALVTNPGVEFTIPTGNPLLVDIKDSSFDIFFDLTGFPDVGAATTFVLSDLDWVGMSGEVIGLSLTSGDVSSVSSLSFTTNSVTVNLFNLTNPSELQRFSFDINTSHVSEPANIALLSLGLIGVAFARRKKS